MPNCVPGHRLHSSVAAGRDGTTALGHIVTHLHDDVDSGPFTAMQPELLPAPLLLSAAETQYAMIHTH